MNFKTFSDMVTAKFNSMSKLGTLYITDISKDELKEHYQLSFPEGTNLVFRERAENDCNTCNRFIRVIGNVVSCVDGELVSIWDVPAEGTFKHVAEYMSALVKSRPISMPFMHDEKTVGKAASPDNDTDIVWNHFNVVIPDAYLIASADKGTAKGSLTNNYSVLKRGLEEISYEALDTVLELINSGSIYRGTENLTKLKTIRRLKESYKVACEGTEAGKEDFLWENSRTLGLASAFRNSLIGTLLTDISDGRDVESSVIAYEKKAAPENYKRSSAVITQGMIDRAYKTIENLGMNDSIYRRHAVIDDISINDVLYADREAKKSMGALDVLKPTAPKEVKTDSAEDINIEDFIANVVPKAVSMEILVEAKHKPNFVSLVAPVHADSPTITKWGNNFTWSYNGELADSSMKDLVKSKGGNTDGALRFSIQWNTPDRLYQGDLDAHCMIVEKKGKYSEVCFQTPKIPLMNVSLDVDIRSPVGIAVENIIFTNENTMPEGVYHLEVNNFSLKTNNNGFTAEVEFDGNTYQFDHNHIMRGKERMVVAKVRKENGVLKLVEGKTVAEVSTKVYGIDSKTFKKVTLLMNSPNYWDCVENPSGNKHYFFILEDCKNEDTVRGFYNEFLHPSLHNDRKVFEVLAAKMQVPCEDHQLSGLGFSETQTNNVVIKVRGDVNKLFKVNFN